MRRGKRPTRLTPVEPPPMPDGTPARLVPYTPEERAAAAGIADALRTAAPLLAQATALDVLTALESVYGPTFRATFITGMAKALDVAVRTMPRPDSAEPPAPGSPAHVFDERVRALPKLPPVQPVTSELIFKAALGVVMSCSEPLRARFLPGLVAALPSIGCGVVPPTDPPTDG